MSIERILVVGAGAREHALAWRLARDPGRPAVLVTPGNPGIARSFRCLNAGEHDVPALIEACRRERIDLVVIGPEAPLALGVADALAASGHSVFGPTAAAARIESSKWFAKQLMLEAGVPTARAESFDGLAPARAALARFTPPWVIKADGLAAGKGVSVTEDRLEAETFLAECLEGGRFGGSGRRVVIEEFLEGEEVSVMAVCDGRDALLLPPARDYKRADDGDRGPNTGGMGAYAPVEEISRAIEDHVRRHIVQPVLAALARRGTPFQGLLYTGLLMEANGPRVLEFNARFGDPETQVVLPLLDGDLARLLASASRGALEPEAVSRGGGAAVAVALVDPGYPAASRGGTIEGMEALMSAGEPMVFASGIDRETDGWRVRSGRAATVVARAPDRAEARRRVYAAIDRLSGPGWRCRRDVAGERDEGARSLSSAQGRSDQ